MFASFSSSGGPTLRLRYYVAYSTNDSDHSLYEQPARPLLANVDSAVSAWGLDEMLALGAWRALRRPHNGNSSGGDDGDSGIDSLGNNATSGSVVDRPTTCVRLRSRGDSHRLLNVRLRELPI